MAEPRRNLRRGMLYLMSPCGAFSKGMIPRKKLCSSCCCLSLSLSSLFSFLIVVLLFSKKCQQFLSQRAGSPSETAREFTHKYVHYKLSRTPSSSSNNIDGCEGCDGGQSCHGECVP